MEAEADPWERDPPFYDWNKEVRTLREMDLGELPRQPQKISKSSLFPLLARFSSTLVFFVACSLPLVEAKSKTNNFGKFGEDVTDGKT